jgi:hypothetical protein
MIILGPIKTDTGPHAVVTQMNDGVTGVTGPFDNESIAVDWAVRQAKTLPVGHQTVVYNVIQLYTP